VVTVSGAVLEYRDLTEIDGNSAGTVTVTGSWDVEATDVALDVLAADAEPWESVLVRVSGLTVSTLPSADTYNEWTVTDGTNSVLVDDLMYHFEDDGDTLAEGDTFSGIQGPLYYSFGNFKVTPRNAADFNGYAGG
jgi:hypothetical protein